MKNGLRKPEEKLTRILTRSTSGTLKTQKNLKWGDVMMNLGYLSPSGEMYTCSSYGHMELATRICNTYEKPVLELKNSLDCESYLLDIGYVCIRSRSVEYSPFTTRKFGSYFGVKVCVNLLTDVQKDFLKNLFETDSWYNEDQMDAAQTILDYNESLRDVEWNDGELMNPLNRKE